MDKVSVSAFVLSLVGVAIVAIPLAIWGIVRTGSSARRGRGFGVAALCISAAWALVASVVLVNSGVLSGGRQVALTDSPPSRSAPTASPTASPTAVKPTPSPSVTHVGIQPRGPLKKSKRVYWEDLKPTMCIKVPTNPSGVYVTVVDCRAEHEEEVMARTVLVSSKKWPGDAAIQAAAESKCRRPFASYVGIAFDASKLDMDYLSGDRSAWTSGDRRLICLVLDPSRSKLTQALRGVAE